MFEMLAGILKSVFGTSNDRVVKSLQPIVAKINSLEESMQSLSDDALKAKTEEFKSRLSKGESLDSLLPEAFATVREASKRVLGMRHFDVQLIGGIILHRGMVSEMKTGEGKTLVATLPIYLNALTGKGVHLVTVNDYLVKRDSEWMGQIYKFLGLTIGCVVANITETERKKAYDSDIAYGTNNEFGFDYLRDNLKYQTEQMVQRPFNFAIVDEVDSILIDEARTPLIISGPTEDNTDLYVRVNKIIPKLSEDSYEIDEKNKGVVLTDKGHIESEEILKAEGIVSVDTGLYDIENMSVVHHLNQALRAHKLFQAEVDYIVKEGKVMIIDEFTGRIMDGRRYSEGLHQALEAKEGVKIENENQTLASITFQNYFRMYPKLGGMTGTAMTEASELADIYKLEVVAIPTNVDITRIDEDDEIYITGKEKYDAIIDRIEDSHKRGQPVLVGTVSIEKSEYISTLLKKRKITHNVLNARHHMQEAEIIAQAGRSNAVTIATNMAGRGTDIKLGGNLEMMFESQKAKNAKITEAEVQADIEKDKQKVLELGGLFVIGTERHESRRIDNQLRGRSGRQGDPGRTKFYLSLEDDLMRVFGSEKIKGLLSKMGLKEGEAIIHPWISKSLEKAQSKVEARNYDIRKNLLKFDDVMNDQRSVIYEQRKHLMEAVAHKENVIAIAKDIAHEVIQVCMPLNSLPEQWDLETLEKEIFRIYGFHSNVAEIAKKDGVANEEVAENLIQQILDAYEAKYSEYGSETMLMAERQILLVTLDQNWKDHLHTLDHLRTGIGLRAYAQKDPLNEYKIEAFNLFKSMLDEVAHLSIQRLFHLKIAHQINEIDQPKTRMMETRQDPAAKKKKADNDQAAALAHIPVRSNISKENRDPNDESTWGKVSRNEECPCGSGKKYKQCHGKI